MASYQRLVGTAVERRPGRWGGDARSMGRARNFFRLEGEVEKVDARLTAGYVASGLEHSEKTFDFGPG